MGLFAAGQVVILPFPYTDSNQGKVRPALLVATIGRGDWLACQITSNPYIDSGCLELGISEFMSGGLHHVSYIRPGKVISINESLFQNVAGEVNRNVLDRTVAAIIAILQSS